jgi:hypothetical protein
MARSFRFLLAVAVVVGLVIGVGIGMWQRNNSAAPKIAQAANPSSAGAARGTATGGGTQAGQAAMASGQGMAFGAVQSVDGKTVVLTSNNSTTKVTLADGVKIYKSSPVAADQIKPGEAVVVTSRTDQDGKVSAASIEAGPADVLAAMPNVMVRGPQTDGSSAASGSAPANQVGQGNRTSAGNAPGGNQGAPAAQATPGARGQGQGANPGGGRNNRISGTVEAISATEISVKATDGAVTKMAISDQTAISKVVKTAANELKAGVNVTVSGKTGSDGTIAAAMVRLMAGSGQP